MNNQNEEIKEDSDLNKNNNIIPFTIFGGIWLIVTAILIIFYFVGGSISGFKISWNAFLILLLVSAIIFVIVFFISLVIKKVIPGYIALGPLLIMTILFLKYDFLSLSKFIEYHDEIVATLDSIDERYSISITKISTDEYEDRDYYHVHYEIKEDLSLGGNPYNEYFRVTIYNEKNEVLETRMTKEFDSFVVFNIDKDNPLYSNQINNWSIDLKIISMTLYGENYTF